MGEERVYLAYTPILLFIIEGSQGRNLSREGIWRQELMKRSWRGAAYWIALAYSVCLLIEPSITNTGVTPSTNGAGHFSGVIAHRYLLIMKAWP